VVRKLEREALDVDLGAVRALLERRTAESDPIGHFQFSRRVADLEQRIHDLGERPDTKASMAVFFAGDPVQGSRGVRAEFAGKAVNLFQELIAKQFANLERGSMATVGPVPLRSNSDMLLTDVARGSVGIILEEADRNESLTDTELSLAVHKVAEDIHLVTLADATAFDELLADVDARYFGALSQLFRLFDDSNATVRLVEREQDFQLDGQAIHRGRERTDAAITNENDNFRLSGRLFILPATRRFELRVSTDETIHGIVAGEFARQHLVQLEADNVVNRDWLVRLKVRTITRPNREPQVRYTLLGLIRRMDDSSIVQS
jgi:hypothetical protein